MTDEQKVPLTEEEAEQVAGGNTGTWTYICEECGSYYTTTVVQHDAIVQVYGKALCLGCMAKAENSKSY